MSKIGIHTEHQLFLKSGNYQSKNKDDNESKEFYYLGRIHSTGKEHAKEILMADGKTKAVELEYRLEVPVRDDMYDYIVNG